MTPAELALVGVGLLLLVAVVLGLLWWERRETTP